MKNIIKTWLKDHAIELPDERIDILITMLKSEPKGEYEKALDDMMGNPMEELEDLTPYPRLKKIQDKKLEIIMNKNSGEELELELDELIELAEKLEGERIIEIIKKERG